MLSREIPATAISNTNEEVMKVLKDSEDKQGEEITRSTLLRTRQ